MKKLVIVALLAFAAGGTCPSDVNNDGTVGINDFLQLLGDWGPCPSSKVISMSHMTALQSAIPHRAAAAHHALGSRADARLRCTVNRASR